MNKGEMHSKLYELYLADREDAEQQADDELLQYEEDGFALFMEEQDRIEEEWLDLEDLEDSLDEGPDPPEYDLLDYLDLDDEPAQPEPQRESDAGRIKRMWDECGY